MRKDDDVIDVTPGRNAKAADFFENDGRDLATKYVSMEKDYTRENKTEGEKRASLLARIKFRIRRMFTKKGGYEI